MADSERWKRSQSAISRSQHPVRPVELREVERAPLSARLQASAHAGRCIGASCASRSVVREPCGAAARRSWLQQPTCTCTPRGPHGWTGRGAAHCRKRAFELAFIASTICKTNGANPRGAARPGTLHQAIDGKRQRRRAPLPRFCQNCSAARSSFDKPIGTRHGPRRRPCRVRGRSASRGRTAAASLQNDALYRIVRIVECTPSAGLQRVRCERPWSRKRATVWRERGCEMWHPTPR